MFGSMEQISKLHTVAPTPERLKKNQKVLILTGDKVEDMEFFYPYYRLTEEGYTVDVATIDGGTFEGKHSLGLTNAKAITDIRPNDYALLYLPGGKAPATLRENEDVLSFVRQFAATGKPIAAICHGPQILVSADLVRGKQMAAFPEVGKEIEQAGGTFVDEALVEDGQFITGRVPGDLPRHLYGTLQVLQGKASETPSKDHRHAA